MSVRLHGRFRAVDWQAVSTGKLCRLARWPGARQVLAVDFLDLDSDLHGAESRGKRRAAGLARRAIIGLGSNVGSRAGFIRCAIALIEKRVTIEARSRIVVSTALGRPARDYYNAAVRVATEAEPESLLGSLQEIEHLLLRKRAEHWGPRTVDLDLLAMEGYTCDAPNLVLPHVGLLARAFAVGPFMEVAGGRAYGGLSTAALQQAHEALRADRLEPPMPCTARVIERGEAWLIEVEGPDYEDCVASAVAQYAKALDAKAPCASPRCRFEPQAVVLRGADADAADQVGSGLMALLSKMGDVVSEYVAFVAGPAPRMVLANPIKHPSAHADLVARVSRCRAGYHLQLWPSVP